MKRFRSILVAIDSRSETHPALRWATRLAEHNQARLTIVDVLPDLSWIAKRVLTDSEHTQDALAQQKLRALQILAEPIGEQGVDVRSELLFGKTSSALMHEVLRSSHDLVVRVTKGAHSGRSGFFGTTSMRLLRECPCAVWLVRPDTPPRFTRVLAAIDPAPEDVAREALNHTIIELAKSVAEYEHGELHVLHAWEFFGEYLLKSRYKPGELAEAKQTAESSVAQVLDDFLSTYGLRHTADNVHLLCDEWGPGHAVSQFAKQSQVDLVIMGTMASTGWKATLLGNTAEQVLDHVECAILAIKPDKFTSPATLPDQERVPSGERT